MIWLLVLIYIAILTAELPPLLKERSYRDIWALACFFIIALYMSLALYYSWPLAEPFEALVTAIGREGS